MGLNIVKAGDFEHSKTVIGLIYGETGSGKSTFAGSGRRTLVILSENNGAASINKSNPNTDIIPCYDMRQLHHEIIPEIMKENLWENIVLDSFTDLQERFINTYMEEWKAAKKKSTVDFTFWGDIRKHTLKTISLFRDIPGSNKWVLCRLKIEDQKNEIGETILSKSVIDLSGKNIHSAISARCNLVGMTKINKNGDYVLGFRHSEDQPLKPHPAMLNDVYIDPTIDKLVDEITGKVTKELVKTENVKKEKE